MIFPPKINISSVGQYTRHRAPHVEFRVGDVITHTKLNFRGVIIGWDEHAIAPEKFLKVAHGENKVIDFFFEEILRKNR